MKHLGEIDNSEFNLQSLVQIVSQRKRVVATCLILCTVGFTVAAFIVTPVYRSVAILMPASSERAPAGVFGSALGQLGGLASIAGINIGSADAETVESLAVIRSRQFTEKFIQDNDILPKLFPSQWDAHKKKWAVDDYERPTFAKGSLRFHKKICDIIQDKKAGVVIIQIDWKNRFEAAAWANELVQRLNREMRSREIIKADASIGYLEKELKNTTDIGTQQAINRLIETQIRQRMLATVSQQYSFRVIDPALPADVDDPIFPKKYLFFILGPLSGVALASLCLLLLSMFTNRAKMSAAQ